MITSIMGVMDAFKPIGSIETPPPLPDAVWPLKPTKPNVGPKPNVGLGIPEREQRIFYNCIPRYEAEAIAKIMAALIASKECAPEQAAQKALSLWRDAKMQMTEGLEINETDFIRCS